MSYSKYEDKRESLIVWTRFLRGANFISAAVSLSSDKHSTIDLEHLFTVRLLHIKQWLSFWPERNEHLPSESPTQWGWVTRPRDRSCHRSRGCRARLLSTIYRMMYAKCTRRPWGSWCSQQSRSTSALAERSGARTKQDQQWWSELCALWGAVGPRMAIWGHTGDLHLGPPTKGSRGCSTCGRSIAKQCMLQQNSGRYSCSSKIRNTCMYK